MNALTIVGIVVLFQILLLVVLAELADLKSRRDARKERRLDFSKCYHNQIHSFMASDADVGRCDYCGRPSTDSIHKVR